jgi:hypothetical protein
MAKEDISFSMLSSEERAKILKLASEVKSSSNRTRKVQFVVVAFEGDRMLLSSSNHMVEVGT